MADDEPLDPNAFGYPLDREPVEAEAPDTQVLAEATWQRVRRRNLRDGRVKGRVEDRDVRAIRQKPPRVGDRRQGGRVVERRQLDQLFQPPGNRVVDDRGLSELGPAVDDAVRDGGDVARSFREGRNALGRAVRRDERELQARRARVDDEDRVAQ